MLACLLFTKDVSLLRLNFATYLAGPDSGFETAQRKMFLT